MNNRKTMSAVFEKISNGKKVNLESQKIELGLGDNLKPLISNVKKSESKLNKELNNAFEPIRRIESAISKLTKDIDGFSDFNSNLQKLEVAYQENLDKLRDAESDLGVKIPFPKPLSIALKELEELQRMESTFRREIAEYKTLYRKFK